MKTKRLLIIFSLICTLSLLGIVTYSWIARSWTPQLEYSQVSISTTGALIISIENKDGTESYFNEVNVNDFLGLGEFVLKQVSSVDGKNFVSANFNPILDGNPPVYDENVNGKYIETEFWLKTQYETDEGLLDRKKEVFLHEDSYIKFEGEEGDNDNVELTIRVSIEIESFGTYILCVDRDDFGDEVELTNGYYDEKLFATNPNAVGQNVFVNYPNDKSLDKSNCLKVPKVYPLDYFNGNNDRILFTISPAAAQKVTLRIWLEGCDDYCLNEIAGKNLSILLKFDTREAE